MTSWTKDQSLAISDRGGKIIVSAAAGSGKTAVLSERVIKLILEGVSVSELLIVTFTKAAAEEMKSRIKDKIKEAYEKDPSNEYLKKELSLVDLASITTMDSFYGDVVKENFEKLGVDKNFSILPNEEEIILKNEVLKNVLEDSFELENYEKMLGMFGANKTDLIKDLVLKIDSFLGTLPYPETFIKKMVSNYDEGNDFYKDLILKQVRQKMWAYNDAYTELIEAFYNESEDFDKILDLVRKEKNYVADILSLNDFDSLSSRIRTIAFDTLRTPRGHGSDEVMIKYKVIRDEFKKDIRKNYHELTFITEEVFKEEQKKIREVITCLFNVVSNFRRLLLEEKKKKNAFSFGDIAHFVIELTVKDGVKTTLARDLSKRYKEILIDEYQDTNNLQNVIFNAISNDDKNLFIVGDVKQSIYRFRSACPEIFNNDKNSASKDDFPKLITLSKNFRSRKEVLDFSNFVFENTMSNSFGEVEYDDYEKLYLGASFEEGKNLDTEVLLIDGIERIESGEEDLTKTQKEAIVVAEKIKSLLDSKHKVYDNKLSAWRCIKPSDIVILLRSLKDSEVFASALRKRNISVYMESSLEYFDNYEVRLIINFLKVIDNPHDDIALMSVLNSSLVNASVNNIAYLRIDNTKVSLYDSLKDSNDEALIGFFDKLDKLREYGLTNTLSNLLANLYKDFECIPVLTARGNALSKEKNLMQMINHASKFEEKEKRSLHEFIDYLENVILSKGTLEGVNPLSEGDNVLITTIHKSKGLEYPVVILSETGKNFNFKDVRSSFLINEELGFVSYIRDDYYKLKYETIPMLAFKEQEKRQMLSEEERVLYVALTRAKEKIIITGYTENLTSLVTKASSKIGDKKLVSRLYLSGVKNYLDIIIACLLRHPSLKELRSYSGVIPKTFATESKVKIEIKKAWRIDETEFLEKEKQEMGTFDYEWYQTVKNFTYESSRLAIPKYLSVSDLKKKLVTFVKPNFLDDGISHTNKGTIYHKVLELLPVKKYGITSLEKELDNMLLNGNLTKEELKIINLEDIFCYLTSSVYDMLLESDTFYKEFSINFEIPASYYDKSLKSGNILTSGIIDLLFKKGDVYTIVDYKTDNVNSLEELRDRYKTQLDLYEIGIKEKMNAKLVNKFIYSIKLGKFIKV